MSDKKLTDEEVLERLDEKLSKERVKYSKMISSVVSMINHIERISEAQVLMLSYRHMLVDKISEYKSILYKKKSNDLNYKKLRYEFYKTKHDLRLDYREINQFIESDMAQRIRKTNLIESQINFFSQCIETLDKMGFAIKAKIQIEEINLKISG